MWYEMGVVRIEYGTKWCGTNWVSTNWVSTKWIWYEMGVNLSVSMSLPHKEEASRNSLVLCWNVPAQIANYLLRFERGSVKIEIEIEFADNPAECCYHGLLMRQTKITVRRFNGPRSFAELTSAQYSLSVDGNCADMGVILASGSITGVGSPIDKCICDCKCKCWRNCHFRLALEAPGGFFPIYDVASCDRARWSKFGQLFNNPKDSDVTVVTASGEEIKVRFTQIDGPSTKIATNRETSTFGPKSRKLRIW